MMRHLYSMLLFIATFATYAATSQPILAILDAEGINTTPNQIQEAERAARLTLQQTQLFRVLTPEEIQERTNIAGEDHPATCLTQRCYRQNAEMLGSNILATLHLFNQGERLQCQFALINGEDGAEIESIQYSESLDHASVTGLVRHTIQGLLGMDTLQTLSEISIHRDSLALSPRYSHWAAGALVVASGFAVAAYALADRFQLHDGNSTSSGFTYSNDSLYPLSGIQGFFSDPRANARLRALSGAGIALAGEQGEGLMNPAGLAGIEQQQVSLSTAKLPAGAGSQFEATWESPFKPGTWWGEQISFSGDDLASEMIFTTRFAWDFSLLSSWMTGIEGGINVKGLVAQVGQGGTGEARSTGSGMGAAVDVGMQWQIWNGPRMGIFIENPWSAVYYSNTLTNKSYREDLATTMTIGSSWQTPWNTILALDLKKAILVDQHDHLMFGLEQNLFDVLTLRAGMHDVLGEDLLTWSLGASVKAKVQDMNFEISFAYEDGNKPYDLLTASQIFTINLKF